MQTRIKNDNLTARCVRAAQLLKHTDAAYYAPVIRLLLANEKHQRDDVKPKRKRKQILYTERGEKIELYRDTVRRMSKP